MNTLITHDFINALRTHSAIDATEEKYRLDTISFIERHPNSWWQRSTVEGHVTAAAWLLNAARTHALLLHHTKLDRWLQPGGHLDDTDGSPAQGALREAMEETGIPGLALDTATLFDIDVHLIPARNNEAAHLHYDARYVVLADETNVSLNSESLGARWLTLHDIAASRMDESIVRLAKKNLLRNYNI